MQSYDHYGQGGAGDDQDDDYSPPSSSSRDPKAADKSKADVKPSSVDKGDRKGVINRVNREYGEVVGAHGRGNTNQRRSHIRCLRECLKLLRRRALTDHALRTIADG